MIELHAISPNKEPVVTFTQKALQIYDVVDFIHLRERNWTVQQFSFVLNELKKHDKDLSKIIINDRLDIAYINNIKQVHIPSHGFNLLEIQNAFPTLDFGSSVHDVKTAKLKEQQGAHYVIFGHVYETHSKQGLPPRGLNTLTQIVQAVSVPVIAIGGITPKRIPEVFKAGAQGVAIMSGIFSADNCQDAAQQYRQQIKEVSENTKTTRTTTLE